MNSVIVDIQAVSFKKYDGKVIRKVLNFKSNESVGIDSTLKVNFSGTVAACTSGCTVFKEGDHVLGSTLIQNTSFPVRNISVDECDLITKPSGVDWAECVAVITDGVPALQDMCYLGRITPEDRILVCDGYSSAGSFLVQLAHNIGAKIWITQTDGNAKCFFESMGIEVGVIELKDADESLSKIILKETGDLGLDALLETSTTGSEININTLQEYVSCLGVGGRFVTTRQDLQIDPPIAAQLHLRGASVGFSNPYLALMSRRHQGRNLHAMQEVVDQLSAGQLKTQGMRTKTLVDREACEEELTEPSSWSCIFTAY